MDSTKMHGCDWVPIKHYLQNQVAGQRPPGVNYCPLPSLPSHFTLLHPLFLHHHSMDTTVSKITRGLFIVKAIFWLDIFPAFLAVNHPPMPSYLLPWIL